MYASMDPANLQHLREICTPVVLLRAVYISQRILNTMDSFRVCLSTRIVAITA